MSLDPRAAQADLAFLRALVDDGAPALRAAGAVIALAGVVFGLGAFRLWLIESGWLDWPDRLEPLIGWDALVVQLILAPVVLRAVSRGRPRPRGSAGGRAVAAALTAIGGALAAAMIALAAAAARLEDPRIALAVFPIVIFAVTGAAWFVVHAVYQRGWALAAALGAFATALVLGWFAGTPTQWLVLGFGLLAWLTAPGLALVHNARSSDAAAAKEGVAP